MKSVNLIFPHQLFEKSPLIKNGRPTFLIEEFLFFSQYKFHKQKIALHRATMKFYAHYLTNQNIDVTYIEATDIRSDIRLLIQDLNQQGVEQIYCIDPTDKWLANRMESAAHKAGIHIQKIESPLFINNSKELESFFDTDKKKFFQTKFYIQQRKKWKILLDQNTNPIGGKWSFDAENRKKYPKHKQAPKITYPVEQKYYIEAQNYVKEHFNNNPGTLSETTMYPHTFKDAAEWFTQFLNNRFNEFGTYEDAIVADETILNHSVLTPALNIGLLTPQQIINTSLKHASDFDIPINSVEGFVRQIIGWREFIRGMYSARGSYQRTKNYWGFTRKIPASFYDGSTGIEPIDSIIKKLLKSGYNHHIERLMVLGNFMLLCEFDPDEVYQWFMEMYIDAYDWVMVPNVYGMSQFADGGLMATKPYISGSNYLMKMSNFKKGDWQKIWDGLFWRFMHVHRTFFLSNPRLGMLVRMYDKMPAEKQKLHLSNASSYLESLGH